MKYLYKNANPIYIILENREGWNTYKIITWSQKCSSAKIRQEHYKKRNLQSHYPSWAQMQKSLTKYKIEPTIYVKKYCDQGAFTPGIWGCLNNWKLMLFPILTE